MISAKCKQLVCFCIAYSIGGISQSEAAGYVFTEFNYPAASDTTIQDINNQGDIVGEFGDIDYGRPANPGMQGYLRRGAELTPLNFPGATQTSALGINNLGIVVGEYGDAAGKPHGFVFDGTNYRAINYPNANATSVSDINDAGLMVGIYQDRIGLLHGFLYDGQRFSSVDTSFDFQFLPIATSLQGINNAGVRVGTSTFLNENLEDEVIGFSDLPLNAIRVPGGLIDGSLGVAGTFAEGINEAGVITGRYVSVVGGFGQQADVEFRGYVYNPEDGSYVDVDMPGGGCTFSLVVGQEEVPGVCVRSLQGINDAGTLVGYFDRNDGQVHGVIAVPDKGPILGDFDGDGQLAASDIDALTSGIISGTVDKRFDLTGDGTLSELDRERWIKDLRKTYRGDADLNGLFDTTDFVVVFQRGEYEDTIEDNSTWGEGDWNGDLDFDSSDLIASFQEGGFEQGPRLAISVPEPMLANGLAMAILSLLAVRWRRTR